MLNLHIPQCIRIVQGWAWSFSFYHRRISCFNCHMASLRDQYCFYSMISSMVLNQHSWRNINCALGKFRYCLISVSVSLYQCFKGGFCWFVYQVFTHLFTYAFIYFVTLVRRLTVTFFCFTKKKRNIQTLAEVLFLVCKEIHNSNKTLLSLILSTKAHFFFNTSHIKQNS